MGTLRSFGHLDLPSTLRELYASTGVQLKLDIDKNLAVSACRSCRARLQMSWGVPAPQPSIATFQESPDTLVYRRSLSQAENLRLFELYAKATPRPRLLKVTSSGGDITLGMELGEWVFRNGLDVEVVDHCFSSCANYVFTAGKAKYLNPDAVLM